LLQGDVGSGKTIIAMVTLLISVENGYQGALMVPTEILAEQHYRNFIHWLTPLGLKVGLLTGKAHSKRRRETKQGLENGEIHLVVRTLALILDNVQVRRLGAGAVDEQHGVGVRQPVVLKNKGEHPDMFTMTATPILRTVTVTLYWDSDIIIPKDMLA